MVEEKRSPAELAAEEAINSIYQCLDLKNSFLLEAGAGAGKTYSLIQSLRYLVEQHGEVFIRKNQQIACITYTNVACDEIKSRVDGHPIVLASTIHAFCWSLIKDFQPKLWEELSQEQKWKERLEEAQLTDFRKIEYDFGYPRVEEDRISLGHNDVIVLTSKLIENSKFRKIFTSRFPVLFIDEYQDTNKDFVDAILKYFVSAENPNCIIGFFGDRWQKIYGDGCGLIEHDKLIRIKKHANFRSDKIIVEMLNRIRPDLNQAMEDPDSQGEVLVFHTNDWNGTRRTEGHWKGDLPSEVAHKQLEGVRGYLKKKGWDFDPQKTKILMLTNNVLANEQGYSGIASIFSRSEDFLKQEDAHINYFVNILEPICIAFEYKQYGVMFGILEKNTPTVFSIKDKQEWFNDLGALLKLRSQGTVGEVLEHLKKSRHPRLSSIVEKKEKEYAAYNPCNEDEQISSMERLGKLKEIAYKEVIALTQYIEEKTPFSTKHGVKGAEFENVLVVVGRGWNLYNFDQYLQYASNIASIPSNKIESYERNRNLFYVAVSRPKKRLTILFTQLISPIALSVLCEWVGSRNIQQLEVR